MSLAERESTRPALPSVNIPVLDGIYAALDPGDRDVFLRWLNDLDVSGRPTYAAAWVADQLTAEGHAVSETTITKARRRGWEPKS